MRRRGLRKHFDEFQLTVLRALSGIRHGSLAVYCSAAKHSLPGRNTPPRLCDVASAPA